jgi:hypothetical protein
MNEILSKDTPINSPIKPKFKNNFLIRIAWYDKIMNKYQSASWHPKESISEKVKWVQQQNKRYPYTHYWLEGCYLENNEDAIDVYGKNFKVYPNIETFNVFPICKFNATEYILL